MTTAAVTDGRNARSQRTRTAVVDALLDLNREGNLRPTAREIAERAGVSLRSVYVHFDDLEDLFLAATKRHMETLSGLLVEIPTTGPLRSRAETLVRARGRMFEEFANVSKAATLQEPFSPTLAHFMAVGREVLRDEVRRVFATELEPQRPERRERAIATVSALASSAYWEQLRRPPGLDVAATRHAVADAIIAVLEQLE